MPVDVASSKSATRIRVRGLTKRYGRSHVVALDDVSLDVDAGEKLVLLGPSGCGKTTLLRCVAGLEVPDAGEIEIDGRTVFSSTRGIVTPPEKRGVSMVFQSYALWPHMTVFDNVAYPLVNLRTPKDEIRTRVMEALRIVGCDPYAGRFPSQLSGGQQQRISLARAIVGRDSTILFDEPLSNVDAQVREQLRGELASLQRSIGFSALYVTHDQSEALALAHRIAVMKAGRIEQIGSARDIYDRPSSRYVAEFTGAANSFAGHVIGVGRDAVELETEIGTLRASTPDAFVDRAKVHVVIRPEYIHVSDEKPDTNAIRLRIESAMFLGIYTEYMASCGNARITLRSTGPRSLTENRDIWAKVDPANISVFASEAANG